MVNGRAQPRFSRVRTSERDDCSAGSRLPLRVVRSKVPEERPVTGVLAGVLLSGRQEGRRAGPEIDAGVASVRDVVLHMTEDTTLTRAN